MKQNNISLHDEGSPLMLKDETDQLLLLVQTRTRCFLNIIWNLVKFPSYLSDNSGMTDQNTKPDQCMQDVLCYIEQYYVISSSGMNQFNISTDQLALLSLKSQIIPDPFHFLDESWSLATSAYDWVGVTCGSCHQRVRFLNLSNMDLTCVIPRELGNLTFLVSLDLGRNNFHGNLPQEMSHLHRLKFLDLSVNSFSGRIEFIAFTGNSLLGYLPNGLCNGLPILKGLYLSYNKLHCHMPTSLSNCSQLQVLSLSKNEFDGRIHRIIPHEIGNLVNLVELWMARNQITGSVPISIYNISSLQILSLWQNNLSGFLPREIGRDKLLRGENVAFECEEMEDSEEETIFESEITNDENKTFFIPLYADSQCSSSDLKVVGNQILFAAIPSLKMSNPIRSSGPYTTFASDMIELVNLLFRIEQIHGGKQTQSLIANTNVENPNVTMKDEGFCNYLEETPRVHMVLGYVSILRKA
ncbi:receptor-like protein 12 [Capsicum annuum]|uniref:receptor-like protein 12 n=1 Tax=Capsicum annuum TaxID=4072 RepID=UPI001FB10622|nr:receptor-like protein 12 [Capsicum annuum]